MKLNYYFQAKYNQIICGADGTNKATTQAAPKFPTGPLPDVNLGDDCQFAHCAPVNSACVTKWDSSRVCECISQHVMIDIHTCKPGPVNITLLSSISLHVDPEQTGDIYHVKYDGLTGYPSFFTTIANLIPRGDHITLIEVSDGVTLQLRKALSVATSYGLYLSTTSSNGPVSVHQVVPVSITLNSVYSPKQFRIFVIDRTRKETVISTPSSPGFRPTRQDYTYSLSSNDTEAKLMFRVDETSGGVLCRQDVSLTNVMAKEVMFDVTAKTRTEPEIIVAHYNVLVLKDEVQTSLDENTIGVFARYILQSSSFVISNKTLPADIEHNKTGGFFHLLYQRDYEIQSDRHSAFMIFVTTSDTSKTTGIQVVLNIDDMNDEEPHFSSHSVSFDVLAGSFRDTVVGVVHATDPDTVGSTTYTVEGHHRDKFSVTPTGIIKALVDLEKKQFGDSFILTIRAYDGVSWSNPPATVKVTLITLSRKAVNISNIYNITVMEERPNGTFVVNVATTNYSNYHFQSGRARQIFTLNQTTGDVVTARKLDRETDVSANYYDILASKDTEDQCTTEIVGRLHYQLQDINDNAPQFDEKKYTGSIMENSPWGTNVSNVKVELTDKDIGPNADISLQISGSTFGIVKVSDYQYMIRLEAHALDREVKARHVLKLTASDNPVYVIERKRSYATITISVLDSNDNRPVFNNKETKFSIVENLNTSVTIVTINATDADEGSNAEIRYMLKDGYGFFEIELDTGELRCKQPLDREVRASYPLTVIATDGSFATRPPTLEINVDVLDTNDNAPVFGNGLSDLTFSRPEEQKCNTLNITITAKDIDDGINGSVLYSIFNSSIFSIDSNTGVVTCTSRLDYETENKLTFVVIAKDKGIPPKSSNVTVRVRVLDINDHSPVFSQPQYNSTIVKGKWRERMIVLVVRVSDEDSMSNITLSINKYQDVFHITSGTTGIVTIKSPSADQTSYDFNITATDNGQPAMSNVTSVHVDVSDQGQANVKFNATDYVMYTVENSNCSVVIGYVSVETRYVANYTLLEGYTDSFEVDRTSGAIKCKEVLDREITEKYTLVVRATSGSDTSTGDVAIVTVHVHDVNDNPPRFEMDSKQLLFQIREDVSVSYPVTTLKVEDKDTGNNARLEYSITGQHAGHLSTTHFKIDRTSGVLMANHELDRETTESYSISVSVHDNGTPQLSSNTTVLISLLDVNDNAPKFHQESYDASIAENAANGDELTTVNASDPDFGSNGTVAYVANITQLNNPNIYCPFQIFNTRNKGGVVSLSAKLDYETTPIYECEVTAVDMGPCSGSGCDGRLTGTATLTVNVLDYNDNAPQFQNTPYRVNISRDFAVGGVVTTIVHATDADTGGSGIVTFSLLYEDDFFDIRNDTGELYLKKTLAGFGKDDIKIRIEAKDNPTNTNQTQLRSNTTMKITIQDDNPSPLFKKSYMENVTEEQAPSGKGQLLKALDRNQSREVDCNCTYRIKDSEFSSHFSIDSKTGEFTQVSSVNREITNNTFKIEVEATDDGYIPKSTSTIVNVFVADINDNRPYFTHGQEEQTFSVNQSLPVSSVIGCLESVDNDENPQSVYMAVEVDDRILLHKNGTITVGKPLVSPLKESYQIKFTVSVKDTPPLAFSSDTNVVKNNLAMVVINVNYYDPNQHAPEFTKVQYATSLDFNSKKNTPIDVVGLTATDGDGDAVSYHIVWGNVRDIIRISSDSGQLFLNYDLDDTIESPINLTVAASDDALYPKTGTCLVRITLKNTEPTQCISRTEYSRLGQESKLKTTYSALFGVMIALLVIVFIITIVVCYKWRVLKKEKDENWMLLKKYGITEGDQGYSGTSHVEHHTHHYRAINDRDFSEGIVNPKYISTDGARQRQPCRPPEPEPDYDGYLEARPDDIHLNNLPYRY